MTTRFTRLSVVADDQQLDASLPAARPIVEYLDDIHSLLGLPVGGTPVVWALSSPARGPIAIDSSLDDAGVLDGEVLYLTPAADAAEAPMVDDVVTALTAVVDRRASGWDGIARDRVGSALLAAVGLALVVALASTPTPRVAAVLLALLAVLAAAAGRRLVARGGVALGWALAPAALAMAAYRASAGAPTDVRVAVVGAGLTAGIGGTAWAVHRGAALGLAGIAVAVVALSAAGALAVGVAATALAAWAAPVLVLVLGLAPQLALTTSGLVALVRKAEAGDAVGRVEVEQRAARGTAVVDAAVVTAGVVGAVAVAVLIWTGRPVQGALGGLLAGIFLLRSRGFSSARQVGVLLAVPIVGLVVAAAALPSWLAIGSAGARTVIWAGALIVAAGGVALGAFGRLSEVPGARLSRLFDRLDLLAVLVLVPLTLWAQEVFGWLADRF